MPASDEPIIDLNKLGVKITGFSITGVSRRDDAPQFRVNVPTSASCMFSLSADAADTLRLLSDGFTYQEAERLKAVKHRR